MRSRLKLALLSALALIICMSAFGPTADAALARVGQVDPNTGFPLWFEDTGGQRLQPCIAPSFCLFPPPNPNQPPSTPGNIADHVIYWGADATMMTSSGGIALLALSTEGGFLPGGVPRDGQQVVFNRIRIRVDNLAAGETYTITHPYGVETFIAPTGGRRSINYTEDVGCIMAPCGDFTSSLAGRVGPWLSWDPAVGPAAPAGFAGDPNILHTVTGSPIGANVFRIEGPNVGGLGINMIETDLFSVQGQIASLSSVAYPRGGPYNTTQSVKLMASDPEATIRYTLNGTTPTMANGRTYTGTPITVTRNTTLNSVAVGPPDPLTGARAVSPVRTDEYTIDRVVPAAGASPSGGVFNAPQSVALSASEPAAIYYTLDGSTPGASSTRYKGPVSVGEGKTTLKFVAVDPAGNVSAISAQDYTVDTIAPRLGVNPAGGQYNAAQSVALSAKDATATKIYYTLNGAAPTASNTVYSKPMSLNADTILKFMAVDAAGNTAPVRTETYEIDAAAPTASASPSGGTYNTARSVALSASEPGSIYYTLDGSTPSATGTLYSGPINISTDTTLRFRAFDRMGNSSAIVLESYVLDTQKPVVSAATGSGVYNTPQKVVLTASDDSATRIRYTLDGSAPTATSTLYTRPLNIGTEGATTLKYLAVDTAGNQSAIGSQTYRIDTVAPRVSVPLHSVVSGSQLGTSAIPVRLTWSGGDGGSGIASYQLQRSTSGGVYVNVGLPTAGATSLSNDMLTPGRSYRFRVRAIDRAGNASAFALGRAFTLAAYQDGNRSVRYTGRWAKANLVDAYGRTVRASSTAGSLATLKFTSKSVSWVAPRAANRGKAQVRLDGRVVATVDLYSSRSIARQVVWSRSVDPRRAHTLQVRVLGTKRAASKGRRVDVDAFVVMR